MDSERIERRKGTFLIKSHCFVSVRRRGHSFFSRSLSTAVWVIPILHAVMSLSLRAASYLARTPPPPPPPPPPPVFFLSIFFSSAPTPFPLPTVSPFSPCFFFFPPCCGSLSVAPLLELKGAVLAPILVIKWGRNTHPGIHPSCRVRSPRAVCLNVRIFGYPRVPGHRRHGNHRCGACGGPPGSKIWRMELALVGRLHQSIKKGRQWVTVGGS